VRVLQSERNAALFLQTDPIPGGSANAYDYANQDPINNYDLGGTAAARCPSPRACAQRAAGLLAAAHESRWLNSVARVIAQNRGAFATVLAAAVCASSLGAGCLILTGVAFLVRSQERGRGHGAEDASDAIATIFGLGLVGGTSFLGEGAFEEGSGYATFLKIHAALPDLFGAGAGVAASYTNRAQ
jgi:hypothetical protein